MFNFFARCRVSCAALLVAATVCAPQAFADDVYSVELDPSARLTGSTVLGEWDVAGDAEGWESQNVSGLTVSSSALWGTASAGARVFRAGLPGNVDLDLGWNDFLQIRMRLPLGYGGDVRFRFGTSTQGGFADSRVFTLPAEDVAGDGDYHTYRLDLGLIVWWRDTLTDLEIQPLGEAGAGMFAIDYVEVGDVPGDVLAVNTNLNRMSGETLADLDKMESKHAVCWWSPTTLGKDSEFATGPRPRRMLRMIEESYQVYCKKLGYREPFHANGSLSTARMKTNATTWYDGFWMSGGVGDGRPYFNVGPGGLADEGWGNPVPHEFAHCVQGAQPGFLTGGHWESHANFLRLARNSHYAGFVGTQVDVASRFLEFSNTRQDHKRLIYADYRIHQAVTDFADDFGLPWDQCARMWIQGSREQTAYVKLDTALPAGASVQDFTGFSLRHWPFLDFENAAESYKDTLWTNAEEKAFFFHKMGTVLIPLPDKPGWHRSPFERSPEKYGFVAHELQPSGGTIEAELRGFDLIGEGEGWRWSLVATDAAREAVRYSEVKREGESLAFNMQEGETRLYLVVVATPDDFSLDLESFHNTKATDKHADRLHYPYEVRLSGATPTGPVVDLSAGSGAAHPNGGGWVASTARVDATAYVGPNARVLGAAQVRNNARVEDYAVVMGGARVENEARVSGYAIVTDNARVVNGAKVRDRAFVEDNVIVEDFAMVEDSAHPQGATNLSSYATARGISWPFGDCRLSGTAIADYNYSMNFDQSTGVLFEHVPWGAWFDDFYIQTQRTPRGLTASYRMEAPEGEVAWDEFGAQHGILRGAPERAWDGTMKSEVLRLNGRDQYMLLDRSAADLTHATYALWIKPATDAAEQTILFLSGGQGRHLHWIARDELGRTRVRLSAGSTWADIPSFARLPVGAWTHLAVSFDGQQARLFVNGVLDNVRPCGLSPHDVLLANDYRSPEPMYVGRGETGAYFEGDVEDVRVYSVALSGDEVLNEMTRAGQCVGVFLRGAAKAFDGAMTRDETGSRHGLARTLEAWIKPDTSDNVSYYEAVFDSNDERSGREGSGFGLDGGEFVVRLENVSQWHTGVQAQLGQWQKVVLTFNGSTAKLAVNDQIRATRSYTASAGNLAGKNYRLGFGQADNDEYSFFDGEIRDVKVYDRFFSDGELRRRLAPAAGAFARAVSVPLGEALTAPAPPMIEPGLPAPVWTIDAASAAKGMTVDPETGIVSWDAAAPGGTHDVVLTATNAAGTDSITLTIEVVLSEPADATFWVVR